MDTPLSDKTMSGTLQYNGFSFGPTSTTPPSIQISGKPVFDDAERAVKYMKYRIDVLAYIVADDQTAMAAKMIEVREKLSRPGRRLIIESLGFGDTDTSDAGTQADVISGAKPVVIQLEPVGSTNTWQLRWQCDFHIAEGAAALADNWLAMNYRSIYRINNFGLTQRITKGHLQVIAIRDSAGDAAISITADQARDQIVIDVPSGFARVSSQWTESEDKSRLDFEITDEELGHDPYPPGIIEADVQYQIEQKQFKTQLLHVRFHGTMEAAADQPTNWAAYRLLLVLLDRLQYLDAMTGSTVFVPQRFSFTHHLFTKKTELHAELQSTGCLYDVLSNTGMWAAIADSDYVLWKPSVDALWDNRGLAGLSSRLADGVVVDLVDNPTNSATIAADGSSPSFSPTPAVFPSLLPTVTSSNNWLDYQAKLTVRRREQVHLHYPAQAVTYSSTPPESDPGVGQPYSVTHTPEREVHGEPVQQIVFEGTAERLQYAPTVPILISVGGQALYESERTETREQIAVLCGIPAFQVKWKIAYDVLGYVDAHIAPQDPINYATPSQNL